jgi:baculoviral IAP repeat-containing protein 7/8
MMTHVEELFEKMKSCQERFLSYRIGNWPVDFMNPKELAEAGFFYLINRDRVQCAFCRGVVCGWEPGDQPLVDHERHFPRCPFLMKYNVGNIPLEHDPIRSDRKQTAIANKISEKKNEQLLQFGIQRHAGPTNCNFVTLEARIKSFTSKWTAPVKPSELAEAGFYFIGPHDCVKCFYCDGELCNWKKGEIPWTEHRRWFPNCQFLSLSTKSVNSKKCKNLEEIQLLCKICLLNEIEVVFLPCGHFTTCSKCAAAICKCPICRTNIRGLVRAFIP